MFIQLVNAQRVTFMEKPLDFSIYVKNAATKEIVIEINAVTLASRPTIPHQIKVFLNKENRGSANIPLKGPAIIKIMNVWNDSSMEYLVHPGSIFQLSLDEKNREYAVYNNEWKKQDEFYHRMMEGISPTLQSIPENDPLTFFAQWKREKEKDQFLVQKAIANGIDESYCNWVWENINSLFDAELIKQLINYISINGKWPVNMQSFVDNCTVLTDLQLNDPLYFNSVTDADLVSRYFLFSAGVECYKANHSNPPSRDSLYQTAIEKAKKIKPPGTKKTMIDYLANNAIKLTNDTIFLQWLRRTLEDQPNKGYCQELINTRFNDLVRSPIGKPPLDFDAVDIKGNSLLYSNFKEKYIYIDVWATWCVPCKREIPYIDELKKEYKEKPIVFLSVSIDKSKSLWEKFVESNVKNESQFHSLPILKNSISNIYQIKYIPRFLLIGPDGNLLNSDCFRPSDPAIKMLFDKLLN